MNPFEMVVIIVAIGAVASIVKGLLGIPGRKHERMMRRMAVMQPQRDPEADRLRDEVRGLKERVAVLERVITDQSSTSSLEREFDKLKSMD